MMFDFVDDIVKEKYIQDFVDKKSVGQFCFDGFGKVVWVQFGKYGIYVFNDLCIVFIGEECYVID